MRTKEEIKAAIENSLNSPTWNALKSSFLGKELIEYATSVIFLSEQQKLSIQDNQYPDTADIGSLLLMAFNRDIPVDLNEPAYIKVANVQAGLIEPYQAYFKFGNISFSNHDYLVPGKESTIYQGNIKTMFTSELQVLQEYERVNMRVFYDVDAKCYFVKLGEDAIASSVRVLKESGASVIVVSEYDVLREAPDSEMVKIKRNTDKSLNVYFGDGEWGAKYDQSVNYQIIWLEGTNEDFDASSIQMTYNNQQVSFDVESYDSGQADSIEYTRQMLKSQMTKYSVVATESQIKAHVNSFPEIVDCVVVTNSERQNYVLIYVKPTVLEDTIFDQITDSLNLYGEIVTQYVVERGNPLYFYVQLTQIGSITQQRMNEIESLIQNELAYENLPYIAQVSSVYLNELISSTAQGAVSVSIIFRLQVEEASNVIDLPTRPYRGSVRIIRDGEVIGWDSEGILYAAIEPFSVVFDGMMLIGDFYISAGASNVYVYNKMFTTVTDNTGYLNFAGMLEYKVDDGRILMKYANKFEEYDINEAFTEGDYSLQKNPTVTILSVSSIDSTLDISLSVYKKDIGIFKLQKVEQDYYLWKYDINNQLENTLNFSVLVSGGNDWTPILVFSDDTTFYAFFKEGLRIVQNYTFPTTSELVRIENIPQLEDLSLLKSAYLNGVFVIVIEEQEQTGDGTNYVYSIYRSAGIDIEEGSLKRLILRSDFVQMYNETFTEQQSIRILEADITEVIFFNETQKRVYSSTSNATSILVSEGSSVEQIDRIGLVSYVDNQIQIQGRALQDVTIEYQTSDALELISKDRFPVLGGVEWT